MPLTVPSRRSFLLGIGAVVLAAPPLVRIASLMPVKALPLEIKSFEYFGLAKLKAEGASIYYDDGEFDRMMREVMLFGQSWRKVAALDAR